MIGGAAGGGYELLSGSPVAAAAVGAMSASPTLRRFVLNAATVLLVVSAGAYVVALILEGTKNPEASQVGVFIAVAALGLAVLGFIAWVAASFFAWIGRTVANDWAEPAKAAQPVVLTEEPTEDPADTNGANEFIDLGTRFKTLARRRRELWRERPVNVKATLEIEQEMADALDRIIELMGGLGEEEAPNSP
jgi:hypothetical protein